MLHSRRLPSMAAILVLGLVSLSIGTQTVALIPLSSTLVVRDTSAFGRSRLPIRSSHMPLATTGAYGSTASIDTLVRSVASPQLYESAISATQATTAEPNFLALACPAATTCLATTSNGYIYRSNATMQSWQAVATPTTQSLYAIACWSSSSCIAVGYDGVTLSTTSGGISWVLLPSQTSDQLSGITCLQGGNCIVTGNNGVVLHTLNGGESWTVGNLGQPTMFDAIYCVSSENCVAGGNSIYFLRTTDGGATWQESPNPSSESISSITCTSSTDCIAVGQYGTIEVSSNGGISWQQEGLTTAQSVASITCPTSTECLAVGNYGTVLKSTDAGSSWSYIYTPTSSAFSYVSCVSAETCIVVGSPSTIIATYNAGLSFQIVVGGNSVENTGKTKVMVIGGSVALSLGFGLSVEASQYGVSIADESIIGCGVVQGGPFETMGKVWPANLEAPPCNGLPGFPQWETLYQDYVDQVDPQVVILGLGRWETVNRMYDGSWSYLGQSTYDAYVKDQLVTAVKILASRGAKVALLTSPYFDEQPPPSSGGTWPEDSPSRVQEFNKLLGEVSAEFPGMTQVIDFGQRLSPDNQYAEYIDGIQVRTSDGVHITLAGGEWIAGWLLPQVDDIFKSSYHPLNPYRICDTRSGNPSSLTGMYEQCNGNPLIGGNPYNITVDTANATGLNHVPLTATAIVLDVTVINPTRYGYLTVYPTGLSRPLSSNLNFSPNEIVSNQVVATPGLNGAVTVYLSSGVANMVIDVEGYYSTIPGAGSTASRSAAGSTQGYLFSPVMPVRICDTRPMSLSGVTDQCTGKPIASHTSLTVQVSGLAGIPLTATAAALEVTFANGSARSGYITVYPEGAAMPVASQLNWTGSGPVTNSMYSVLPGNGAISVYNGSSGSIEVAIDVEGYFTASSSQDSYVSVEPVRICDTRPVLFSGIEDSCTNHMLSAGGTITLGATGNLDLPYSPSGATFNVTVTDCIGSGYLSIYPAGTTKPLVSQVTYSGNYATSDEVTLSLTGNSQITVYSSRSCQVIIDLQGIYTG